MTQPDAPAWENLEPATFAARVLEALPPSGGILLVDGRSGSGKSTVAAALAAALEASVVHTDDVAWHLHPIDWADELRGGVLDPWRRGEPISYRPPGWVAKSRPGAIEVPRAASLIVEGVGAARASLAADADVVVWVSSDDATARRRGLERDIREGRPAEEAEAFWDDWMRSERPFLDAERPWTRATFLIDGTPPEGLDAGVRVARGPSTRDR